MTEYIIQVGEEFFTDTTLGTEPIFTTKREHAHRFNHHGIARIVNRYVQGKVHGECKVVVFKQNKKS